MFACQLVMSGLGRLPRGSQKVGTIFGRERTCESHERGVLSSKWECLVGDVLAAVLNMAGILLMQDL